MSPMLITDDDTQEFRAINPLQVKEVRGGRDNSGRQAIVLLDDTVIMVKGKREDIVREWRRALS